MMEEKTENLKQMMQSFRRLHIMNVQERTFMQLTSYPHLENVCSNILAFFLDTEEAHRFDNLFIKSLLECVGINGGCRTTESIKRELSTSNNNRIDLYIETEKYLIAIENKVYSGINNPFADYEAYVKELNVNAKQLVFLLLSLRETKTDGSAFVNVTYSDLFKAIKKNLGMYVINADTKWIVILNDFIKTMEGLKVGAELDKDFIDFYNEFEADIGVLIRAKKELSKSLKEKVQAIANILTENGLPNRELVVNHKDCIIEYYLPYEQAGKIGAPIYLEIYLDTKICYICIGIEDSASEQITSEQIKELERLLSDKKLSYRKWGEYINYFVLDSFDIYEDVEIIAKAFQHINKILNAEDLL